MKTQKMLVVDVLKFINKPINWTILRCCHLDIRIRVKRPAFTNMSLIFFNKPDYCND